MLRHEPRRQVLPMTALREFATTSPQAWLAIGGLLIGAVFGATVQRTGFCIMGALSDVLNLADRRRLRAWLVAIAVALVATQGLDSAGVVQTSQSMYLAPTFNWLGAMVGGLMFGYGMVFAGGCASRNLARAGSGDLRSLLTVVVVGIFSYIAIGGILGPVRAWLEQTTAIDLSAFSLKTQSISELLAQAVPHLEPHGGLYLAGVVATGLVAYCFADPEFRRSTVHMASGLIVGLCVAAGWIVTGLAFDEMAVRPLSPVSLTFVRPSGDTLEWLQRYTALGWPGFGVSTVIGTLCGAFLASAANGRLRLTSFSDRSDTLRHLAGGALMGTGGVFALGCTIGQGVSGLSTLAAGSIVACLAIAVGGVLGLKDLERRLLAET